MLGGSIDSKKMGEVDRECPRGCDRMNNAKGRNLTENEETKSSDKTAGFRRGNSGWNGEGNNPRKGPA